MPTERSPVILPCRLRLVLRTGFRLPTCSSSAAVVQWAPAEVLKQVVGLDIGYSDLKVTFRQARKWPQLRVLPATAPWWAPLALPFWHGNFGFRGYEASDSASVSLRTPIASICSEMGER